MRRSSIFHLPSSNFARVGIAALTLTAILPFAQASDAPTAHACAFVTPPTTYEASEDRRLYMRAMELAGHDALFPNDAFFSQQRMDIGTRSNRRSRDDVYVPPTLLKAISWIESVSTQGAPGLPFGSIGPALVSFDCGYGIAQVTSGMTAPLGEGGQPNNQQALVATHFAYNIGRGSAILLDKWNAAPEARPVAGIDNDADPRIIENWYYAVWSYNGFTGPGANRSNHPMDPVYAGWPRTPFSCGPQNDGLSHNRSLHPYQELVFGCVAHPPSVHGQRLWEPVAASLPDLNNFYWRTPLDLRNFRYPYSGMDMASPQPHHTDPTDNPGSGARRDVLGNPNLEAGPYILALAVRPRQASGETVVRIENTGTGIVPWRVSANKPWVRVSVQAGVAVGSDMPCTPNAPCERTALLRISVDPNQVTGNDAAVITIDGLHPANQRRQLALFVRLYQTIGVPGTAHD